MQNNAIQLSGNPQVVSWSDVRESLIARFQRVNRWLDSVSPSFSAIAGMTVTRRVVFYVYALLFSIILLVVCLQQAPVVSVIAAVAAICLTAAINHFADFNKKVGVEQ